MDAIGVLIVGAGAYLIWCAYKGYSPWKPGVTATGQATGVLGLLGATTSATATTTSTSSVAEQVRP